MNNNRIIQQLNYLKKGLEATKGKVPDDYYRGALDSIDFLAIRLGLVDKKKVGRIHVLLNK